MIGGRFTLVAPIGRGSMGSVHEAYDERLHRRVALKQLSTTDHLSLRRFQREARLTARLNHPGVPAIYDIGDDYIAMEYIEGHPLQDVIAEAAPLEEAWIAVIGLQIAAVLASAHAVSLIHRDLKPPNVVLMPSGAVKVVDFGVATLIDGSLSGLTPVGALVGTASYRAPEAEYSSRSDLYSLGRILLDLGSGRDFSLTEPDPDSRPASASALVSVLRPLLTSVPPLPAFVRSPARAVSLTDAYLALAAVAPPTPTSARPLAPRQARSEAERLVAAGRAAEAIEVLDTCIAATPGDPQRLELRRDLTRALINLGDLDRAAAECDSLVPALAARLGSDHVAVRQARTWQETALDRHAPPHPTPGG